MTSHVLKVDPGYYDAIVNGLKTFEIRKNDRGYRVGDLLRLKEYDPGTEKYTNRTVRMIVQYIIGHEDFPEGIPEGYVVMAIRKAV